MFSGHGLRNKYPATTHLPCTLLLMSGFLLLPGVLMGAEDEETVLPFGQMERVEPAPYENLPETHAGRPASAELMRYASQEPQRLIGKTVTFDDGTLIGPVLAIRRYLRDEELYLIIDATRFFNNPTEYAVPATDMRKLQDDRLVIAEFTGMHLRGMQYYEEDFTDVDEAPSAGYLEEIADEVIDEGD